MNALLRAAGLSLVVRSDLGWASQLLTEELGHELRPVDAEPGDVRIVVEGERTRFDTRGWEPVTGDSWARDGAVVLEDVCASGFSLLVVPRADSLSVHARWTPTGSGRGTSHAGRTGFHAVALAVLLQYPALWWAGLLGRAPVHGSVVTLGEATPLLTGATGVGKSTLVAAALTRGERAVSDNLCVSDGLDAFGALEVHRAALVPPQSSPVPTEPPVPAAERLRPDRVVVVRRGSGDRGVIRALDPAIAVRSLVGGVYVAPQLRRYWGFAAALALGLDLGPVHPPVEVVAQTLATGMPCFELVLPVRPSPEEVLDIVRGALVREPMR